MSAPLTKWTSLESLRLSAEGRLREEDGAVKRPRGASRDPEALARELEVHGVELEMQNEALRDAHRELEASRAHYQRLFDLLPSPCLTLSPSGHIIAANLSARTLLAAVPDELRGAPLSRYVLTEHAERFERCRRETLDMGRAAVDLAFRAASGAAFEARLEGIQTDPSAHDWLVTLTDLTEVNDLRRLLQESQRIEVLGVAGMGRVGDISVLSSAIRGAATGQASEFDSPALLAALDITVLLVEGNQLARLAARAYLEEMRCEVIEAGTAQEALQLLAKRKGEIRLLMADVGLPDLDGREFVRRIRAIDSRIAVVLTIAHAPRGPREAALPASCGDVLQKPFSGQALLDTIRAVLRTTDTVRPPRLTP